MHSILTTHRNRHEHLAVLLWSLRRSARICGAEDWELIVAEHGSLVVPATNDPRVRILVDDRPAPLTTVSVDADGRLLPHWAGFDPAAGHRKELRPWFPKSRLWNLAIDAARGELLTFLDCDMLVGRRFLESADDLVRDPGLTRVCYRVRNCEQLKQGRSDWLDRILAVPDELGRAVIADYLLERYEQHPLAYEAYGGHWRNCWGPGQQPWGNSQFSMRREDLSGLRFCEEFTGRGFEDLDFNAQVERRFAGRYRAVIHTDPDHGLLHWMHDRYEDWHQDGQTSANHRLYRERNGDLQP